MLDLYRYQASVQQNEGGGRALNSIKEEEPSVLVVSEDCSEQGAQGRSVDSGIPFYVTL